MQAPTWANGWWTLPDGTKRRGKRDEPPILEPRIASSNTAAAIAPQAAPKPRKIAVVGMAPSSRRLAPYADDSWEIWGLNTLYTEIGERWNRHFEMHGLEWLKMRPGNVQAGYIEWLQQKHGDKPIYMLEPDPAIPNAVPYPLKAVTGRFGHYFRSTIDYMLALAILEAEPNPTQCEIGVWGVDMALTEEYREQRPSCEFYIGLAMGRGIPVHVPPQADIMKVRRMYGQDSYDAFPIKLEARRAELQQRQAAAASREAQSRDEKMMLRGALDQMQWDLTNWT
jgi:hypothetical protein